MDRVKISGRRVQILGNFVEVKSDVDGSPENLGNVESWVFARNLS